MTLKSNCPCFKHFGSTWTQLGPDDIHAYRVTCTKCNKFIKWGTRGELIELRHTHAVKREVPFAAGPPKNTVDMLFK
jgi:hypothetical protein